jgi:transposase-like protein
MYAKGMSTRDIEDHMRDIYGIDVSPTMVSKITDKILPMIAEWQSRPLDRVYPIIFLDAIHFKVRKENRIVNKAAYSVLGINISGQKDILGIWIGENESASFWLGVCNDLKNRGVEDILIACKDGLSGFSEAINTVFPQTEIQLCVIHQIRNSLKYVPHKEQKELMADLKQVYQALTMEEAELAFEIFKEKWSKKHPIIIRSWENNWLELTAYFKYPYEIRKIIYTTNVIEGYHRQLRKVTKTKTAYPTDEALKKIIYLATVEASKKWTMPIKEWKKCISQFAIHFGDRLQSELGI